MAMIDIDEGADIVRQGVGKRTVDEEAVHEVTASAGVSVHVGSSKEEGGTSRMKKRDNGVSVSPTRPQEGSTTYAPAPSAHAVASGTGAVAIGATIIGGCTQ